jgi:catechol 2,3-dioxygenase
VTIDPATSLANVELVVGDLDAQTGFYRDAIGLRELRRGDGVVELGASDGDAPLVTLIGDPDAPVRPRGTTGLFHLALLVADRAELARAVNRVAATGHGFTGASDHLVSEALYLNDPEGNGIEIYRDRPREDWPRAEGELQMATLPLDLDGVLASAPAGDAGDGMAEGTTLGHVHLQVG